MNSIKKIAVLTTIRSEYGLLKPLLKKIDSSKSFDLQLLVGGAHLNKNYGFTKTQIIEDGFNISGEFDFLSDNPSSDYLTKATAKLTEEIGLYFQNNKPDLFIVLGDRFELLAAVSSALIYNIPIAHISGGDVTEGAVDNQIRNAITKMSHLHFPATEIYKQNILKMGEEAWRICVCGEPGLDELLHINFYSKEELFKELELDINKPVICATFHPETISNEITPKFIENLFLKILEMTDYQILVTSSNFDHGGNEINDLLGKLTNNYPNLKYIKSLGQRRYYSLLSYASLMLGNSSSGLVEAQSFNIPVLNVGDRQFGRLANKNVYNVIIDTVEILNAIKVITTQSFLNSFKNQPNIYGDGNASDRIINFIKTIDTQQILVKRSTF